MNCSTECYVDDTKLFVSFHSQDTQQIVEEMNEDLGVRNWCFRNRLLLNPDKTKLIFFGSRQMTLKLREFRLSLLGKNISPVQSAKDLGVILDSNLTFDDHIKTTVSECIAYLAQIDHVKHCLDRTSLLTLINALVSVSCTTARMSGKIPQRKYTEIVDCAEVHMSNHQWREKVPSSNSPLKKFVLVTC